MAKGVGFPPFTMQNYCLPDADDCYFEENRKKFFEMPHIATFAERKIFRHRWENS